MKVFINIFSIAALATLCAASKSFAMNAPEAAQAVKETPSSLEQTFSDEVLAELIVSLARPIDSFLPKHQRTLKAHATHHGIPLQQNIDEELIDAVTAIRNLSHTNTHFNTVINDPTVTQRIIDALVNEFVLRQNEAAGLLATRGALNWLIQHMPEAERERLNQIIKIRRDALSIKKPTLPRPVRFQALPEQAKKIEKKLTELNDQFTSLLQEELKMAIIKGDTSSCAALLQERISPDVCLEGIVEWLPLLHVYPQWPPVISMLLAKGAKPHSKTSQKSLPKKACIIPSHWPEQEVAIYKPKSALDSAASYSSFPLSLRLLARYIPVNNTESNTKTPLMQAVNHNSLEKVCTLLDLGANPCAQYCYEGKMKTAADLATDPEIKKILQEAMDKWILEETISLRAQTAPDCSAAAAAASK